MSTTSQFILLWMIFILALAWSSWMWGFVVELYQTIKRRRNFKKADRYYRDF